MRRDSGIIVFAFLLIVLLIVIVPFAVAVSVSDVVIQREEDVGDAVTEISKEVESLTGLLKGLDDQIV
jgi:hypothetical protein